MCVPARRKPRLLVLNQYYWPGVEATAQLLTELCEALAEDIDITVVTGVLHGHEDEPRRAVHNGVEIVRVPSTSFERSKLCCARCQLRHVPRERAPPGAARSAPGRRALHDRSADRRRHRPARRAALSRAARRDQPGRLSRDRHAAQAPRESRCHVRCCAVSSRSTLKRADRVVAIGDTMRERLEEKGAHGRIVSA